MKVLLISHNPICTYNGMGKTFASLFSTFNKEELCQLYIYPSFPDLDMCSSYFQITDKEVLKSLCIKRNVGKQIRKENIRPDQQIYENPGDEAIYRSKRNKKPIRKIMRDAMWRASGWNNASLNNWLQQENPTIIFVAPGDAVFLYNIALQIARDRKLPIVVYICDEYYFMQSAVSGFRKIQVRQTRKKMEELMSCSSYLITICDELKSAYQNRFLIPAEVIMTGCSNAGESIKSTRICREPRTISYFGNVRSNRYLSLLQIGKTLDELNLARGSDYKLKVYTSEKDETILEYLSKARSISVEGFLQGEEYWKAFYESDFLLHTEAFDKESMEKVRHSISTKIADSLASGIPLIAYGPGEIASIRYLRMNKCALIAQKQEDLERVLKRGVDNRAERDRCVKAALEVAAQNHDTTRNSRRLHAILESL